jgi:hypothetical protein
MVNDVSLLTKQEIKSLIALRKDLARDLSKELQSILDDIYELETILEGL